MDARVISRRSFIGGSLAAGAGLYLGGCGNGTASSRGTVRLAGGTFGFPSPFAYIGGPGYVQMNFIYDTLLWKDASGRLLPWLAKSVRRSADGRTYSFALRSGVRWHDGRPLTAEDVAFTFEYFLGQSLGPLLVAQPFNVRGARATGPLTVDVELAIPAVTFLDSVADSVPIIPQHVWQPIRNAPQAQSQAVLVGSGPYKLVSLNLGEGSYLYEANDDYFLGRPFVRRIELVPVDDELVALQSNVIDIAETAPEGAGADVLATFKANPALGIVSSRAAFTFPLIFNLGKGGPLADVRFRRACMLAVDRPGLVSRLLTGNGLAGNPGFLPPGHPFYVPVEQYDYSPAAAAHLLDQAGYRVGSGGTRAGPHGEALSFQILTGNAPVPPVLELVVASWQKVGIAASIRSVDLPTLFADTQQNADAMALTIYPGPGGTSPNADPDMLRTFFSSRIKGRLQGAQGWADPEFDDLADRQLMTANLTERKRLIARMQQIIAAELPALTLYYPTLFSVFRKSVFDQWYYTPGGMGGGLPSALNKQALVTGMTTGLAIRRR